MALLVRHECALSRCSVSGLASPNSRLPPRHCSRLQKAPRRGGNATAQSQPDETQYPRSRKGPSYENKKRRRGRPAWLRTPYDTPLRDGNRDRLMGLLTERAAKTLVYYLSETNLNLNHWLIRYIRDNPIPKSGVWDDVSGETFLRNLLSMPIEGAKFSPGRPAIYDNFTGCGVDPRNIAQRIMAIRSQIAEEWIQELKQIAEENAVLLRESVSMSFSLDNVVEKPAADYGKQD